MVLMIIIYYIRADSQGGIGDSHNRDHTDIGVDLTTVEDINIMRTEMRSLTADTIKYIRDNYNLTLTEIVKNVKNYRGNSDQWTMAIAMSDIDGYKEGEVVWCAKPALICSGNIRFCHIAHEYNAYVEKNGSGKGFMIDNYMPQLRIVSQSAMGGATWIVAFNTIKTTKGIWIKRGEMLAYPIAERRIMIFTFGIYDYTGVLYDDDLKFTKLLKTKFDLMQN